MFMAVMAAAGVVSGIFSARAEQKEKNRQLLAARKAAKFKYSVVEENARLMGAAAKESAENAIEETLRAKGSANRKIAQKIDEADSKLAAHGDMNMAVGNSKGRQIISLYIKGNEMQAENDSKTQNMMGQIIDAKNKQQNAINQKVISSYNEMAAVLEQTTTPTNTMGHVLNGLSTGISIGSSIGGISTGGGSTVESSFDSYVNSLI